ncbi:MAG: beta-galactosidase [Verrucomicrobiae bacterium]|nr:beta-galactosidase [Verrucomicrobiae bacterium]
MPPTQTLPLNRLRLFAIAVILSWAIPHVLQAAESQKCQIQQTDNGCVLENAFVKVTVNRLKGGRITSLIHTASGKEFTADLPVGGAFKDMILKRGFDAEFWETSYELNIKQNTPERASVELSAATPKLPFLKLTKTYSLSKDRSDLAVAYQIDNLPAAMVATPITFRNHNYLKVNGEKNLYFYPYNQGTQTVKEGDGLQAWHRNLVRSWAAFVGEKSRVGLACNLDYPYLDCFYNWFGQEINLEWFFRTVKVEAGDSFKTRIDLVPFREIGAIDGAKAGFVAGFNGLKERYARGEEIAFSLDLASARTANIDLEVDSCALPSDTYAPVERKSANLKPDSTNHWNLKLKPSAEGTLVLRCRLREEGKDLLTLQRPVVVGKASGTFVQLPAEAKSPLVENALKAPVLTRQIETPHIPWARPWYQGRGRVLFIANQYVGREIIELAQRLDMDFETALLDTTGGYGTARYYLNLSLTDCNQWLKELLKKEYDTLVIAGSQWPLIDETNRNRIIEKVKQGTGLVMICPTEDPAWQGILPLQLTAKANWTVGKTKREKTHYIVDGIPWETLPAIPVMEAKAAPAETLLTVGGRPVLTCRQDEKNRRVVALNYNSKCLTPIPNNCFEVSFGPQGSYPSWEYFHALLAKAILWTSHKEGDLGLVLEPGPTGVALSIRTPAETGEFEVDWDFRDSQNRPIEKSRRSFRYRKEQPLAVLPFPPDLPRGVSHLNLRILEKGKVRNFGACPIQKETPVKISLEPCTLEKQGNLAKVSGKLIFEAAPPLGASLLIEIADAHQRIVSKREMETTASEKAYPFEMAFLPLTRSHSLRAEARSKNTRLGEACQRFCFKIGRATFDDFHEALVQLPGFMTSQPPYLQDLFWNEIVKHGFRTVDLWNTGKTGAAYSSRFGLEVAEHNLAPLFIGEKWFNDNAKSYAVQKDLQYLIRRPCLNDPAYLEEGKKRIEQLVAAVRDFEPKDYIFGDENSLTLWTAAFDFCFCPHCLRGFRTFLKAQYGNIEQLNTAYQSQHKTFDEVVPLTAQQAKERRSFAPWMDHRRFMEHTLAKFYTDKKNLIQQLDPGARVGISGTQLPTAFNGMNWELVIGALADDGVFLSYNGPKEYLRSFSTSKTHFAPWVGYANTGPQVGYWQWWNALAYRGGGYTYFTQSMVLNEDFTPSQQLQDLLNSSQDLRNGVGKLLGAAEQLHDGIALLYSQNSLRLATILDEEARYTRDHEGWCELLNEAGRQWNYVRPANLKTLSEQGYRMLILSCCLSLSQGEIGLLREFVAKGGVVIADMLTGLFDDHGVPYKEEMLADLFGLRRPSGKTYLDNKPLPFKAKLKREQWLEGTGPNAQPWSIPITVTENATPENGGKAVKAFGRNVFFSRSLGKGKGVFLNFGMESYPDQRREGSRNQCYLGFARDLFEQTGVPRLVSPALRQKDGAPAQHCRIFSYRTAPDARYYGVLRDFKCPIPEKEQTVEVVFGEKRHLYDVRKKQYLGLRDRTEVSLAECEAALLAALPYEIKGLALKPNNAELRPAELVSCTITVQAKTGTPTPHVVRLEVFNPKGKLVNCYGKNILVPAEGASHSFPLAWNDPVGKWTIKATDIISGREATTEFKLHHP